ncbi:MAG: nuclear transport factor 2 family protein [Actinomycetota bacterium]
MAESSTAEVVRRYFDAVGRHDLDAAMACWAPGAIDNLDPVGELRVPEELRAYFEELFASMPDFKYEVLDLFEQGDKLATHWRASGSFSGRPYQGMRPNGAKIETEGADLVQVENGLIKRLDSYWDDSAIARQIGVLPPKRSRQERIFIGLFNTKSRLESLVGRRRG